MAENLEIKARLHNYESAHAAALALGARAAGIEHQCDTFFHTSQGRLKLREIEGKPAYLIAYQREDRCEAKVSHYELVPVLEPYILKRALMQTLGVRGEVRKRREILFWKNIRIHLDRVERLGEYLEYEAVLSDTPGEDLAQAQVDLQILSKAMGVRDDDLQSVAYADLLKI